jgi:predicted MFS family arabinose efflux permease
VSASLFASLFAAQAGLIAVTPVLADVARDLDVTTAAAGQLRAITGLVAGVTALTLGRVGRRLGLGRQLLIASVLLAAGSVASAASPSFPLLALAQVPVGMAVAVFTTAGTLAAAEWAPIELRTRVVSWALIGQPAAWLVGMPLVGVAGEASWRLGWVALPLAAALVAGAAVAHRANESPAPTKPARLRAALSHPGVGRWLGAETLANTAWAGTLVYSGALFVETYELDPTTTGLVLALGAGAYIAGNRLARELEPADPQRVLIALGLGLALATGLFSVMRSSLGLSVALFSAAAFIAGARTLVSSAYGLSVPAESRPAVIGGRAASMQFGYLGGSSIGGLALLVGGYTALGVTLGLLLVAAAVVLGASRRHRLPLQPHSRYESVDLLGGCAS